MSGVQRVATREQQQLAAESERASVIIESTTSRASSVRSSTDEPSAGGGAAGDLRSLGSALTLLSDAGADCLRPAHRDIILGLYLRHGSIQGETGRMVGVHLRKKM